MYPYRPLSISAQEIRLIHLKPGRGTDEIECSLVHAPFPPTPDVFDPKAPLSLQASSLERPKIQRERERLRPWGVVQPLSNWGETSWDNAVERERLGQWRETSRENEREKTRQELQLARQSPSWEGETSRQSEESSAWTKSALTSVPVYEALSYTWGVSLGTATIFVDDNETYVSQNLCLALLHLRLPKDKRVLWIDAICINQQNVQERNQQVGIMRRIYMAATRVISFVGSEVRDLDLGLDFVEFLNQNLSKERLLPLIRHYKYEKQWRAVENLWTQEYWKRVWVIQEVVVASEILVCYGHRTIPWEKFSKVIKILSDLSETGELRGYISMFRFTGPAILDRLRRRRELKGEGWPLGTLLEICLDTQSTDPRDKIYGLLGLQDPITDHADILYIRLKNQRSQLSPPLGIEQTQALARESSERLRQNSSLWNERRRYRSQPLSFPRIENRYLASTTRAIGAAEQIAASVERLDQDRERFDARVTRASRGSRRLSAMEEDYESLIERLNFSEGLPEYARTRIEQWAKFDMGMAPAPRNFPRSNGIAADYSKSTLELWVEVMGWPNLWDDFSLLRFSQLVQETLGEASKNEVRHFMGTTASPNEEAATNELGSSARSSEEDQASMKFLGKQKAGASGMCANLTTRNLYYTAGICRSDILFLGSPYTSLGASLKILRQWIKLYFHPIKKLENIGELPSVLTTGITQAQKDLHRIVPIYSPNSYAEVGEWTFVRHQDKELDNAREVGTPSNLSSLPIEGEELCFNTEKISPNPKLSSRTPKTTTTLSEQARWFISNRGQIGLAPYTAKEGDQICQFKNCDVAALIRKTEGFLATFELAGRAILMPRWDEMSDSSISNRFRYSIPDTKLWENRDLKEVSEIVDQERVSEVSLYLDIKALWELTK